MFPSAIPAKVSSKLSELWKIETFLLRRLNPNESIKTTITTSFLKLVCNVENYNLILIFTNFKNKEKAIAFIILKTDFFPILNSTIALELEFQ